MNCNLAPCTPFAGFAGETVANIPINKPVSPAPAQDTTPVCPQPPIF